MFNYKKYITNYLIQLINSHKIIITKINKNYIFINLIIDKNDMIQIKLNRYLNKEGTFKFKNGCPSNTFYLNKKIKQLIINKII